MACRIAPPAGTSGEATEALCPTPPSKTGSRRGKKRAEQQMAGAYLDWALGDFSGYIGADELYDGPFCVLSIVDNRTFKRIHYQVLDHDPTKEDITAFFRSFHAALEPRGLVLRGITTDGSALYPEAIAEVFGAVPHQICEFHVIAELTKAVLGAVAKVRKELAGRKPKLSRGRPSKQTKKAARKAKRLQQKIADLFEHRYLFVKHHLTPAERKRLRRITRGLPPLRGLREIMDQVYGLFDRPRRPPPSGRIAIDMLRDARAQSRYDTTCTLHHARAA